MMLRNAMIAAACLGLVSAVCAAQEGTVRVVLSGVTLDRVAEIDKAIDSAWRTRQSKTEWSWTLVRTPYFASESRPTPKTTWTSYLAAYGIDIKGGLRDGQHVSQPWARITYDNGARTLSLSTIGDRLVDSTQIQGVRPLGAEQLALLKREPEFRTWVLTHPQWPQWNAELRQLQQFYVTWTANNGVLTSMIAPRHDDFIKKWINVLVN